MAAGFRSGGIRGVAAGFRNGVESIPTIRCCEVHVLGVHGCQLSIAVRPLGKAQEAGLAVVPQRVMGDSLKEIRLVEILLPIQKRRTRTAAHRVVRLRRPYLRDGHKAAGSSPQAEVNVFLTARLGEPGI